MSDAFSDLWNSSTLTSSKQDAPKTLGGSVAAPSQVRGGSTTRKTPDVFSLLASSNPQVNSRPNPTLKPAPASQPRPPAAKPPNGNDAFQDLLGGSISASTNGARITIAERAAQVEQQKLEAQIKKHQATSSATSAWQGLDSLAEPKFINGADEDDWGFGPLSQPPAATLTRPKEGKLSSTDDDWGLDDFGNTASTSAGNTNPSTPNPSRSRKLWDIDDLMTDDTPLPQTISISGKTDQNNALLSQAEDEDDILGDLGKPVDSIPRSSQNVRDIHEIAMHFLTRSRQRLNMRVTVDREVRGLQVLRRTFSDKL